MQPKESGPATFRQVRIPQKQAVFGCVLQVLMPLVTTMLEHASDASNAGDAGNADDAVTGEDVA